MPNTDTVPEGAVELRAKFDAMKRKYLGDRRYWYLNLIGKAPERKEKGTLKCAEWQDTLVC